MSHYSEYYDAEYDERRRYRKECLEELLAWSRNIKYPNKLSHYFEKEIKAMQDKVKAELFDYR